MENLEDAGADPAFAQTVRNRLDAIARMGRSPLREAMTPLIGSESDGDRVSTFDELTRARPPLTE